MKFANVENFQLEMEEQQIVRSEGALSDVEEALTAVWREDEGSFSIALLGTNTSILILDTAKGIERERSNGRVDDDKVKYITNSKKVTSAETKYFLNARS